MALVPYRAKEAWTDPFTALEDLQNEMNRLWNLPAIRGRNGGQHEGLWAPAVDVHDEKDKILVKADIPGMTKDQIDILVENDVLTIKGEKKQEKEVKEKDCIRSERYYGSFYRSFSLPSSVDAANVKASYKDGVLEIALPKKADAKSKQVKVEIK